MTAPSLGSEAATRVADQLLRRQVPAPWDVYGELLERYEIHFNGTTREMVRTPVRLEGVGMRVLRPVEGKTGIGFAATSDLSETSIDALVADAEATARFSRFPAARAELPSRGGSSSEVASYDPGAWERPEESLEAYLSVLFDAFDGRVGVGPSFGSVHLIRSEATLVNSSGLHHRESRTEFDREVAVKAEGGPEGRPPGEYWVTDRSVRLDPSHLRQEAAEWCQKAQDVRRATAPSAGPQAVVLPPRVLSDILPAILGFRLSGVADLRGIAPKPGDELASPTVSLWDDGLYPFALGTSGLDDEGSPQVKRELISHGRSAANLYDLLHASAAGRASTGSGLRHSIVFPRFSRFDSAPGPEPTTLVVGTGDLGTDAELAEVAQEGIWVDQLGYAFPDPLSAAFGGEVRLGYRIRGGKIGEPVRGGTVGGVVVGGVGESSLMNTVIGVGRHPVLAPHLSAPTMVVNGLGVGGAESP
ncbi:MAG: metallopeptidase TldD-related protein [Thermoplasmata archaeon]|nr:metallopeptidase TldD-related protein [Thermoplasmata archaeon]